MKKQILALLLCCATTMPALAATVKPFSIANHSNKAMLAAVISDAKIDLAGTVFGVAPIGQGQSWSSLITLNNPGTLNVVVAEDDGLSFGDLFNDNTDVKIVCVVTVGEREDNNSVFANAAIQPGNSTHHCSVSNDAKSLNID